jgi:hypothetical protein
MGNPQRLSTAPTGAEACRSSRKARGEISRASSSAEGYAANCERQPPFAYGANGSSSSPKDASKTKSSETTPTWADSRAVHDALARAISQG